MVDIEPSEVLEVMKILVSPANFKEDEKSGKKFDDFLQTNVLELRSKLETKYIVLNDLLSASSSSSEESGIRWNFVLWNLKLLSALRYSMATAVRRQEEDLQETDQRCTKPGDAPPLSADTLSFTQQKTVLTSVQLVVCLGICPSLLPGVGIPVERRSQYGKLLHSEECEGVSQETQEHRLLLCLQGLLSCIRSSTLCSVILPRHLSDFLAALCQLCHGPKIATTNSSPHCSSPTSVAGQTMSDSSTTQTEDIQLNESESSCERVNIGLENCSTPTQCKGNQSLQGEHLVHGLSREDLENVTLLPDSGYETPAWISMLEKGYQWCQGELQRLLDEAPKTLLIRDLLLLQGGPAPRGTKTARCPVWLRKTSGRLLAQQLTRTGGIQHLLNAMLQGQPDAVDWRKCDAVAQIIARCPRQTTAEEYYRQVAPQLIELLHMNVHQMSSQYLRVTVTTIIAMTTQDKDAAQEILIKPLLNPLLQCTERRQSICQPEVSEQDLSQCVLDIHKVFVTGSEPQSPLLSALQPVLHVLFQLYCFVKLGVSHLRQPVEDILVTFLQQTDQKVALVFLQLMAFGDIHDRPTDVACVRMSDCLDFAAAATGDVAITTRLTSLTYTPFDTEKWDASCQCLVHLLKQLHRDGLTAEFFLFLLQELTAIVSEEACEGIQLPPGGHARERVGRNLKVLGVLASLSEHLGASCFSSTEHILQLAQVTLERGVKVLEHTNDETVGVFETETLTLAMGLLTAILSHPHKLTSADRDQTKSLLPLLQRISDDHSEPNVQEMATDLRIAIATHGIVLSELARQTATDVRGVSRETKQKAQSALRGCEAVRSDVKMSVGGRSTPLIEVLSSCDIKETSNDKCVTKTGDNTEVTSIDKGVTAADDIEKASKGTHKVHEMSSIHMTGDTMSPLEQALGELCDSLVPVRGHALITLTRLLQQRDPATMSCSNMLLTIFRENLDHPDTYIYLQAVAGLAALGDTTPDTVLPTLLREYSQRDGKRSTELRMKLGETIVRISRRLGDMMPAYRESLVGVLLCVVQDTEPLVRASCLSNLGDVCKLLRFSLGSLIHEVFECISRLLKTDPHPEVRKAAAMFLTLLLQGMDTDTIQVLDTVLRDLYRLLKFVLSTESEDMVKAHVQLALEDLDTITRRLLFPQQTLTKKISILHP